MKNSKRLPNQKYTIPLRWKQPGRTALLYALLLASIPFFLAGCAGQQKQWGASVPTELRPELQQNFAQMVKRDRACPETMIADLAITYSSPLQQKSLSGYLQFSLPGSYKFALTNPLGQVFWAVAGDRKTYQAIDTTQHLVTSGTMKALILQNQLPLFLIQNDWGDWLMARNRIDSTHIVDIHKDLDERGMWFTLRHPSLYGSYEHLLIEPEQQILLQRILADRDGDRLAVVTYEQFPERTDSGQCVQPGHITVTGLDYGSRIELELTAVEFQPEKQQYTLPKPPQYLEKHLP